MVTLVRRNSRQHRRLTWAWLSLAGGLLTGLGLACSVEEDTPGQRVQRLTIFAEGPQPLVRGKDNVQFETNGEALVARTLIDPHDAVFDVGAYMGDWSRLVSDHQPTASIYAFEPAPDSYPKLQDSVGDRRIVPVELALSDQAGVTAFQVYQDVEVLNSFYERQAIRERWNVRPVEVQVQTERLDTWCKARKIDHIDYLKIDTEGAELLILRGASEMLAQQAISLVQFEYGGTYPDAGISLKEVYEFLSGYRYDVYRILPDGLLSIPEWRDAHEDYRNANFLAVARS
jgi:FkbM family methyltransferase